MFCNFVIPEGMIFRLSGTGSVGATIRVYFDMYEGNPEKLNLDVQVSIISQFWELSL